MKISAGFTKKVMIKQYEPVEVSCFVEDEINLGTDEVSDKSVERTMSHNYDKLFNFCKGQVEAKIAEELGLIDVKKEIGHKTTLEAAQDLGNETIGE